MGATSGIRAGRAFVELGVSDKLAAGLKRAQKRLKAFGAGLRSIGTRIAVTGAAALTPLFAATRKFASMGDEVNKMSARTGISAEALSELGFAAEQSGADLDTLEKGVRTLQRSINDAERGLSTATEALSDLGLTFHMLRQLSPEEQFKLVADRLSRINDPSKRAAVAMQLLGRAGTRLLPMMRDGAKGIEELQEQARALGLTISTDAAKDAALLTDTLNILRRVLKQSAFAVGAALAPTLIKLSNTVTRVVTMVTEWIKQNRALVVSALKIVAAVTASGLALIALGLLISGVGAAVGMLTSIVVGVGTALATVGTAVAALLSPIGLVVAAVATLGGALLVASGAGVEALAWLNERFRRLRDTVTKVVGAISDALAAGDISLAAKILWLSLKLAWQQGVAALNGVWLEAKQFFVGTAQKMWYGALATAQQVWHALEVAWIETTAFLSRTWTNFTSGFQKAWNTTINWTTKRLLELQGLFDDTFDVETAKRMADEGLVDMNAEIERQRQAAVSAREQNRKREREQAATLNEATLAEIGRQFEKAQRRLESSTDAKVAETRRALAEARRQLDEAIAQARRKREATETEGGPPRRRPGDPLAGLENLLAGVGDVLARKISVTGTFSAVAAYGLAGAGDAAERTAQATEQTARNTKRLVDATINGGLAFA